MKKNVASQKIGAQLISATDGSAFTGSVTVYVTLDAGTQAVGSVGSGACTHEGNGYHTYSPAQSETNGDLVAFTFIGTGAVPGTVQVFTSFPQTGDGFDRLGAPAGASVSADVAAVKVDTAAILVDTGTTLDARIPAALVSGRMDVSVGAMAANVLTATAIAADAITDAKVAADVTIAGVTGAVGSVTGLTNATIADQVWDEAISGHAVSGSTGEALSAAGGAGDPWITALPGAYSAGQAGYIVGGLPTAATIADAVWDDVVDGTATARESMRLQNSAMGGKASGMGTTTAVFRDLADTKARITATVDADGNRSAITRDLA